MQNTTNYGLKKPEGTDNVLISDFNENADIIDAQLKARADAEAAHLADYAQYVADKRFLDLRGCRFIG